MKNFVILVFCFTVFSNTVFSQIDPISPQKIANGGYDFVAYHTLNKAIQGKKEFTLEWKGVKYQFASVDNLNLFKSNPTQYLPVCDGYCAWGVAEKGKKVPVNPETFKIINGKLHLFFNGSFFGSQFNALEDWNKNEKVLLGRLNENWKKLSNE